MEITNNKSPKNRVDTLSFIDWATENSELIRSELIHAGISFINEQAEQLKTAWFKKYGF